MPVREIAPVFSHSLDP